MTRDDQFDDRDGAARPLLAVDPVPEEDSADAPIASEQGTGRGTFTRNLGVIDAFAIIISIAIGSGLFTSPGSIDANVPSPGIALIIWLVGGVLAWTGASTLAELGTAIPGEGSLQLYTMIRERHAKYHLQGAYSHISNTSLGTYSVSWQHGRRSWPLCLQHLRY